MDDGLLRSNPSGRKTLGSLWGAQFHEKSAGKGLQLCQEILQDTMFPAACHGRCFSHFDLGHLEGKPGPPVGPPKEMWTFFRGFFALLHRGRVWIVGARNGKGTPKFAALTKNGLTKETLE